MEYRINGKKRRQVAISVFMASSGCLGDSPARLFTDFRGLSRKKKNKQQRKKGRRYIKQGEGIQNKGGGKQTKEGGRDKGKIESDKGRKTIDRREQRKKGKKGNFCAKEKDLTDERRVLQPVGVTYL